MIRDLIYDHPIWLSGGVIVLLSVALSWAGLYIFGRLVHISIRGRHNDVAGFIIAIIGVIDAVLLAFIAVAAWESFNSAERVVQQEANLVGNLYLDASGLPQQPRQWLHQVLRNYVDLVINVEWPAQQAGRIDMKMANPVRRLHNVLARVQPQTMAEQVTYAEMMRTLNELYSARRARLLAAHQGIPSVIWWIIGLGSATTVVFSFFFGMPSQAMHYTMTGMLAGSMALVMVLIVALDWPFRGALRISPEAFQAVRDSIQPGALRPDDLTAPGEPPPGEAPK
jgi:hypothetical protein